MSPTRESAGATGQSRFVFASSDSRPSGVARCETPVAIGALLTQLYLNRPTANAANSEKIPLVGHRRGTCIRSMRQSAKETIPTNRFCPLITGRRLTCNCVMFLPRSRYLRLRSSIGLQASSLRERPYDGVAPERRRNGDITVRDHAHEPVIFAHRQHAGVDFGIIWAACCNVSSGLAIRIVRVMIR